MFEYFQLLHLKVCNKLFDEFHEKDTPTNNYQFLIYNPSVVSFDP